MIVRNGKTTHLIGRDISYIMFENEDGGGCGHILGLFYADNPRLCLYSTGLI